MAASSFVNFDTDFFNKYTTLTYYLSKGALGTVYGPIQWKEEQLAIKQVLFANGKTTEYIKNDIEVKQQIWASIKHKNLTRMFSVDLSQLPKAMHIVMEFAAGGSLNNTLRSLGSENKLPTDVVTDWTTQIAAGMCYLHRKNIVHRDLKSSNILLMEPFDATNPYKVKTLKITDFDEAVEHDHTTTMSFVGTCSYMAPEVLLKERFSKASDIWSFGVLIWEMLSGDIPHKGLQAFEIIARSLRGELDSLFIVPSFPEYYKFILDKCWKSSYEERFSFQQILNILRPPEKATKAEELEKLLELAQRQWIGEKNILLRRIEECKKEPVGIEYTSNPIQIRSLKTEASQKRGKSVKGIPILNNELFIISHTEQEVEVYDSTTFEFRRRWQLSELSRPEDAVSCVRNRCLYISDGKDKGNEILRVDSDGKLITKWLTNSQIGRLSVSDQSTVILVVYDTSTLKEFSADGQLIKEINLMAYEVIHPMHAIKLANGNFVVIHGYLADPVHRLCEVDTDGKVIKSFGSEKGSDNRHLTNPTYLAIDRDGSIMIADAGNGRVVLLGSNFEFRREILSRENGIQIPARIRLDELNGRLHVGEYKTGNRCVLVYGII